MFDFCAFFIKYDTKINNQWHFISFCFEVLWVVHIFILFGRPGHRTGSDKRLETACKPFRSWACIRSMIRMVWYDMLCVQSGFLSTATASILFSVRWAKKCSNPRDCCNSWCDLMNSNVTALEKIKETRLLFPFVLFPYMDKTVQWEFRVLTDLWISLLIQTSRAYFSVVSVSLFVDSSTRW